MDFITQLPKTKEGHNAIFVVVDRLTKVTHCMPTTTTTVSAQLSCRELLNYTGTMCLYIMATQRILCPTGMQSSPAISGRNF
eukprot:221212-Pelagomonas_calceolata.AAC.1